MSNLRVVQPVEWTDNSQSLDLNFPPKDVELYQEMRLAYVKRDGAKRSTKKSTEFDLARIDDLVRHSGKLPWHWSEEDFECWCSDLWTENKLAASSQRKYQTAIRCFMKYLSTNATIGQIVQTRYGRQLNQICHSENCIPHVVERELAGSRPAFTHEQIYILFEAIDQAIEEAHKFGGKDYRPLLRDKAMFYLMYVAGLRDSETTGLNLGSFYHNPEIPELGDFGIIEVWGKGSRGSGARMRMVPVTHVGLARILEWYTETVRPQFLLKADPNETALFLSERGKRISRGALINRFHNALRLAGLEGRGFVPHCLRHTSNTHEMMRGMTIFANQKKLGHKHAATTQGYTHIPELFAREEMFTLTRKTIQESIDDRRR